MASSGEPAPRAAAERDSRRRKRDRLRLRIMRAALELADRGSFRDLTVDEIARASGISRSAFYLHFRDKHDLLLAALGEVASELELTAERWWRGEGPPAEQVRRAIEGVVGAYARQASLLGIATEVATYDADVRALWISIAERFIEATAGHIRSEQAAGLIPKALDPRATAETLVWMNERCCYVYLARGDREPEQVIDPIARVWTGALYPGVIPAEEFAGDDER